MTLRLGEILVQEGLLTAAQLDEALKCQVIFGGRLGTNLIEMGFLAEGDIARALSKKLGVPFAPPEIFTNIPSQVIQAVPREIVEKYRVVPVRLEQRRLTLAMADPANLKATDEIAFRTGFVIKPVITPEIRLVLALEKYYQIERGLRYIQTGLKKGGLRPPPKREAAAKKSAPPAPQPQPEIRKPAPPSAPSVRRPQGGVAAEEIFPSETGGEASPTLPVTLEMVSHRLTEAGDREDIADILMDYLGQEFVRGGLFLVRGACAMGWKAVAKGRVLSGFDQLEIPLDEPSAIKTIAESKSYYLGPLSRSPFNALMLQAFGKSVPDAALLVPLILMGRVVGILYVDGKNTNLGERLFDLQKLTSKAAMAFEILILKNKILML